MENDRKLATEILELSSTEYHSVDAAYTLWTINHQPETVRQHIIGHL